MKIEDLSSKWLLKSIEAMEKLIEYYQFKNDDFIMDCPLCKLSTLIIEDLECYRKHSCQCCPRLILTKRSCGSYLTDFSNLRSERCNKKYLNSSIKRLNRWIGKYNNELIRRNNV